MSYLNKSHVHPHNSHHNNMTSVSESDMSSLSIRTEKCSIATTISDPVSIEVDNLMAQLKLKQTFQEEEDPQVYKCAAVLSSTELSKLLTNYLGEGKKELDEDTREILRNLEGFFKEYLEATKVPDGSKVKELLLELFHKPEHVVFQKLLCNEPNDWIELGLQVIQDVNKKEAFLEQLKKDVTDVQVLRRTMAKDISLGKKKFEEMKTERKKMTERMNPDNVRRLEITLEKSKTEIDRLTVDQANRESKVTKKDLEDLISRYEKLEQRHKEAKQELNRLSANQSLPPDINGARNALLNRKAYLDSLIEQIKNPLEISSGSLDNSVFH